MRKSALKVLLILFMISLFHYADACSVCGTDYTEKEIQAYTFITFLLMLLPIGAFGFLGLWIGRKYINYDKKNP
jgi:succinate dehydrogenase hydrophobic anchor subunit